MSVRILVGDALETLRTLPAESVQCCITSPPYFGLRDYGVPGQMGLEPTPDAYIAAMVEVFREVRRVLRDDGTLWLNIGDSYAGSGRGGDVGNGSSTIHSTQPNHARQARRLVREVAQPDRARDGLKTKDLVGIPWMLAFALRADGWYLRQDIIWHKPNPMPESVRDRCTKSHEYLFLLSKSGRYYFDADAVAEPITPSSVARLAQDVDAQDVDAQDVDAQDVDAQDVDAQDVDAQDGSDRVPGKTNGPMKAVGGDSRNKRSVWTVTTQPFSDAHFATFPPALVEPCILAGCPQGGTVLDPFGGAGTTGLVADRLQRDAILIELNPAYAEMAKRRIEGDAPLFAEVACA